jgi:hypothetical protein
MQTEGVDSIRYATGVTRRKSVTFVVPIGMIEVDGEVLFGIGPLG